MSLAVLLEKDAAIETDSPDPVRDALKRMFTNVFDTVVMLKSGKVLSSGNADAKFQSSSVETPSRGFWLVEGICATGAFEDRNSDSGVADNEMSL